jgi:hypothetical protein
LLWAAIPDGAFSPKNAFRATKLALGFDSQWIPVPKRQYLNHIARGPEVIEDQMTGSDWLLQKRFSGLGSFQREWSGWLHFQASAPPTDRFRELVG